MTKNISVEWYNVHTDDFITLNIAVDGETFISKDFHCLRAEELKTFIETELAKLTKIKKSDVESTFSKGKKIYGLSEEECARRDRLYWGDRLNKMSKTEKAIRAPLLARLNIKD